MHVNVIINPLVSTITDDIVFARIFRSDIPLDLFSANVVEMHQKHTLMTSFKDLWSRKTQGTSINVWCMVGERLLAYTFTHQSGMA